MTARPPPEPAGPAPWRVATVFGLIAVMAVALVIVGSDPNDGDVVDDTTGSTLVGATTLTVPASTTPSVNPQSATTAAPVGTVAPTIAGPVATTVVTTTTLVTTPPLAAGRLLRDVEAAFGAWGAFAVSGDLGLLVGVFDPDGPQFTLLESEAPDIVEAAGDDPDPYVFVVGDPVLLERGGGVAIIRADIGATQGDTVAVDETWDIEMHRTADGGWRLWTTRPVD